MNTHFNIRRQPSNYERLSCRRILQFCGDNPDILIFDVWNDKPYPLNVFIFNAIDRGQTLKQIAEYLEREQEVKMEDYLIV